MAGKSMGICDNDALSAIVNLINESAVKSIVEVIDTIMERFIVSRSAAETVTALSWNTKKMGGMMDLRNQWKSYAKYKRKHWLLLQQWPVHQISVYAESLYYLLTQ